MEGLVHCTQTFSLDKINSCVTKGDRIIGGCIEGDCGSNYVKEYGIFCQTATALDVPVKKNATMSSANFGKELKNLEEITQEHLQFGQKGTLKESIVSGFPEENFFDTQIFVILYYLSKFLTNESVLGKPEQRVTKRMHVHVHRGSSMGPQHLINLKNKLLSNFCILKKRWANRIFVTENANTTNGLENEPWIFESYLRFDNSTHKVCTTTGSTSQKSADVSGDITISTSSIRVILTFGYGYKKNELTPPCIEFQNSKKLKSCNANNSHSNSLVDFYYAISLVVGFDPEMMSGQTNIPRIITRFDTKSDPAILHLCKDRIRKIPNHLTTEWEHLEKWVKQHFVKPPVVINRGIILELTGGIYNPESNAKVLIDHGWHPPGTIIENDI